MRIWLRVMGVICLLTAVLPVGAGLLPEEPRHLGGDNYGFADGSVKWLPRTKLPDGTWAKEPDADWVIWEPVLKDGEEGAGR